MNHVQVSILPSNCFTLILKRLDKVYPSFEQSVLKSESILKQHAGMIRPNLPAFTWSKLANYQGQTLLKLARYHWKVRLCFLNEDEAQRMRCTTNAKSARVLTSKLKINWHLAHQSTLNPQKSQK